MLKHWDGMSCTDIVLGCNEYSEGHGRDGAQR